MKATVSQTNFNAMIEQLPGLPSEIKAEILNSERFEFVFVSSMADQEVFNEFSKSAGINLKPEDQEYDHKQGYKKVALSPEQVTTYIVFIYHNVYMKVRDRMIDMEKKAHFMNAATGRA